MEKFIWCNSFVPLYILDCSKKIWKGICEWLVNVPLFWWGRTEPFPDFYKASRGKGNRGSSGRYLHNNWLHDVTFCPYKTFVTIVKHFILVPIETISYFIFSFQIVFGKLFCCNNISDLLCGLHSFVTGHKVAYILYGTQVIQNAFHKLLRAFLRTFEHIICI